MTFDSHSTLTNSISRVYAVKDAWQDNDRACHYGDGVFTTMKVVNGVIQLFHYHQQRLIHDTQKLGLPLPSDNLWEEAQSQAQYIQNGVLKLVLSCGVGGRGYQRPASVSPVARFFHSQLPLHYADWHRDGIKISISPVKLAHQPLLAGIKHLNRLEQVLIKQALAKTDDNDAIVFDYHNNAVEMSAGNLFVLTAQNTWVTPSLDLAGVAGVMRQYLLDCSPQFTCSVENVTLRTLENAKSIMVTNCLMGLVPIKTLTLENDIRQFDIQLVKDLAEQFNVS